MALERQLRIWQVVILCLWFEQALQDPNGPPVFDANLMFEFLLGGLELNQDNNILLLDEEMASMRPGRSFLTHINDNIPRSLSSMQQKIDMLKTQNRRPLTGDQFESLVLSTVVSAQRTWHQQGVEDREAWAEVLLQLANITIHDLRGSYLFNYA
ncbi:protein FAM180A [Entelurus aequoreus]|uniref:protein FAM180A n=1 Tax=Entelurus aequoreus TaxID=161455 RepID=UPI002B1D5813|nr:protein FAM180A [Entelurus aequoreus]